MSHNAMSVAIVRTLCEVGVIIEGIDESKDIPVYYITVPEFSVRKTINNEDIANQYLAKKFKETITMAVGNCVVKSEIRKGETWTEDMANQAVYEFDKQYRFTK